MTQMATRHGSRHLDHTSLAEDIYWHRLLSREQRLHPWGRDGINPVVRDALMERAYAIADRYQRMQRHAAHLEIAARKAAADAAQEVYADYVREQERLAARRYRVTLHYDAHPLLEPRVVWEGQGFWVASQWAQSAAKSLIVRTVHSYIEHTADGATFSAYLQDHSKQGRVYLLEGHATLEELPTVVPVLTPPEPSELATSPIAPPPQRSLTDAQQRAIAAWQQRMGETMWFPHFIEAVFPERSNQEAGLRASVRRLAREGRIFRQESDGRVTLIRETPPWQAHDGSDCDLPF